MTLLDVVTAPWAITPEKHREILAIYETHLRGDKIDIAGVEARLGHPLDNAAKPYEVVNGAAVLTVHGVIARRMNLFTRISGGVSTEMLGRDFNAAMADDTVDRIIMDIDSPGGAVDGTAELAEVIYAARGEKPITAVATGMMASAAYWIGSAADKIMISGPTTMVGSIGVVATHVDNSRAEERGGFKVSEITAGRHKRMVSSHEPLSREGRESIQTDVDYIYGLFIEAVGKHRGVSDLGQVHEEMADAQGFIGEQAIAAGLVDGVSTLEAAIAGGGADLPFHIPGGNVSPGQGKGMVDAINKQTSGGVPLVTTEDDKMDEKKTVAVDKITADYLAENHADVVAAIKAEGFTAGAEDGAKKERERILAVKDAGLPGHDALIKEMMFDGKTSGGEAAAKVIDAERGKLGSNLKRIEDDGHKGVEASDDSEKGAGIDPNLPLEDRCKAAWEKSEKLQTEFAGNFAAYLAFEKAEAGGNARIFKG